MCKKNICIITEEFRPSFKGGIATWSTELAKYLYNNNYNVTVFLKKRGGLKKSFKINKLPFKINLVRGRDWAFFKKWYIKFYLRGYLKKNEKPTIISTNWELSEGIISFKKNLKFSLITILHGLEVTRLRSGKYQKKINNFKKVLFFSDKVISVSNYTKDNAIILSDNKKIEVIPNFVNTDFFYPVNKKNIFKKKYNIYKDDIIILSLSRLVKRKGHYIVIETMRQLKKEFPNIKYLIGGTGDKKYEKDLKKHVILFNLQKYVHFLGYVNEREKNNLYNLCNVYVMPSLPSGPEGDSEGFGITFLEANACGKPVIGTNVGGISDAIDHGNNGFLIKPNNPKDLEKTLTKILRDENYYNNLSKNSLNHVKNNFDIKLIGKKYESIINKLYDSL